ncbi:protein DOWNY MILDEW RESISTANCE 6-like [Malania oleifera]|uniref:protein DOWNY MILDEW RESISTANCE 6-like n=1 Tax=Malania oleifera TaxID=397392 RepID=UPI0025ADF81C|nr:protein DOWNY MILDEW RESISTANCE 6-like [Malania oleifera]
MASVLGTSSQFSADGIPSNNRPDGHDYIKGVKYLVDTEPNLTTLPPEYVLPLLECPLAVRNAPIPVIDLKGLINGLRGEREQTVQAIGSACADYGFFRVINHGVKVSLMEEMLRGVEEFFSMGWEEKMKYASEDVMSRVRYGTSLNTSKKHALHWRDYFRHFGHPFHTSFHLWPNTPPNYKYIAREYLEEVWRLALKLASAISESLGLDRDYVVKSLGNGCQIVASNYYPPCPEPHRTLGLSAHSDHGGLTILMQNDVDGLQVKCNGEWIAVPHEPGTFFVNLGDYLEVLSNGRYKSAEHRAVVNKDRARISVAVGHGPDLTATVAPAGPLINEQTAVQYRPITYEDYMKAQQSSAVRGKSPLQALMVNPTLEQQQNEN